MARRSRSFGTLNLQEVEDCYATPVNRCPLAQRNKDSCLSELPNIRERPLNKPVSPIVVDMIEIFLKACTVIEVFAFNTMNQLLLQKQEAPIILFQSLNQILECLMLHSDQSDLLQKKLVVRTLRCISVTLRNHQTINDFISHKDMLLLRLIKLMKQHITVGSIVKSSLMVLKQIFSADPDIYHFVEHQLEAQYLKTFLTRIMLLYRKEDTLIQEMTLLCIL